MSHLKSSLLLVSLLVVGAVVPSCQCASPKEPGNSPLSVSDAGLPKPPLSVLSVTPGFGPVAGKTAVTIVGTGFEAGVTARIGEKPVLDLVVENETTLSGKTPPGIPGVATVEVVREGETAQISGAGFTYLCRIDDDCAPLSQGLRCEEKTGRCIAAQGCIDDTNCSSQDPDDYCYVYGSQCRCVTEPNDSGYSGVCRRRRAVCESCTDDSQCGSGGTFDPVGACRALSPEPGAPRFCLQAQQGQSCGCGMVNDGRGYCKPQSNDCSQVGCTDDADCPGGSVCNRSKCLCEARCRWDFASQQHAPPGCPSGTVCWVDNENLDPSSIFYGAGRCRPPCTDDSQCTDTFNNPFGGAKLACAAEQAADGGVSSKRCRAAGECMDNLECPEAAPDAIELGYCDRNTFQCKTDCRVGNDPVTGQPYKDCRQGYKCQAGVNGAANTCVLQTCAEQGGARIACRRGQYCCGEDKNGDGVADPCPPLSERDPNNCYDAPKPPFCTTCESQEDCQNTSPVGWLSGANACANGSTSPNCSPLPSVCIYGGDRPDGTEGVNVCAPSTYNDGTKDSFGVGKDLRGCPAGYTAYGFRPDFVGDGQNYCTTNADCRKGNSTGICDFDRSIRFPDGGSPKACLCTQPGLPGECPQDPDAGVTSVCKFGIATPSVCLQTVVCVPQGSLIYKQPGAPDFGCGL